MRLSPNRCIYAEPPKYQGKGRPRKHGQKMKLSDPTTWGIPVESVEIDDPTWGIVEITRWSKFHFYQSASQPMEIVLIQRKGQSFSGLLAVIGTPAKPPKPRGKSPGWEKGKKRNKRPRYPTVKKTVTRQKKAKKKAS